MVISMYQLYALIFAFMVLSLYTYTKFKHKRIIMATSLTMLVLAGAFMSYLPTFHYLNMLMVVAIYLVVKVWFKQRDGVLLAMLLAMLIGSFGNAFRVTTPFLYENAPFLYTEYELNQYNSSKKTTLMMEAIIQYYNERNTNEQHIN